ncbi:hypothetical protein [Burkholderia pseudomallei]|uniref:hypothetical protein n=1 Tax=Burkholderia pseudomallei TaxID=28450 RepID=UPI000A1A1614|nr:hypothetical protein [Burkholderia pseudomallei]ARK86033.1 hypothetical protein BOC42_00235 [Burkholderia pseudomallei]
MYQIDNASAAMSQPASTAAGTAGFFTDGNPATATPATIVPAEWLNSVMMELINVVNAGGVTPTKNQFNNVLTALKNSFSPVVGSARNLVMGVGTASATATLTADEIIVETALGGQTYRLANFNKTINLATTGAGGMDAGSAPTSGYVALYAIYNPTTGASALLAKNATSAVQPNVYGGGNMPAGYTASALVSVWPTNGSGQFPIGYQRDRSVDINSVTTLSSSTTQASPTALNISTAVPPNAVSVSGTVAVASSAASTTSLYLASTSTAGVGIQGVNYSTTAASGGGSSVVFRNLRLSVAQQMYYYSVNSAGTPTYTIAISSYDF